MKHLLALAVLTALAGCGTFPLSGGTRPNVEKTADQHQLDTLVCQEQARAAANTAGRQTGAFLLGLTLIGTPVAFELEKSKQREVFAQCMSARNYTVLPLAEKQQQTARTDYRYPQ